MNSETRPEATDPRLQAVLREMDGWNCFEPLRPGALAELAVSVLAAIDAAKMPEAIPPRVRHKKRGSTYTVLGQAEVQASNGPLQEGEAVAVYRGDDGKLWVRRVAEFEDGRFEQVQNGE